MNETDRNMLLEIAALLTEHISAVWTVEDRRVVARSVDGSVIYRLGKAQAQKLLWEQLSK